MVVVVQSTDLDLPVLVSLTGPAVSHWVLEHIHNAGHRGVKASHGYVIQRLIEEEPTIGALAASLGMTQQGASKQVNDLQSLGFVERVSDEHDGRIRYVRLTKSGWSVLEAGRQARAQLEQAVVARVGEQDVHAAKRALVALLELTDLADQISTRTVPLPED
jgi:DNA-binding MarR family transcriptional regulator